MKKENNEDEIVFNGGPWMHKDILKLFEKWIEDVDKTNHESLKYWLNKR